jgi:hypothetical protein
MPQSQYSTVVAAIRTFVLVLFVALNAPAQRSTANLIGTLTDANNLPIPGVQVRVLRPATGEKTEAITNAIGDYRVESLPIGEYEILVSHAGFREFSRKDIRLEVGKTVRVDVALQLGTTAERIEVVGSVAALDTETSGVRRSLAGPNWRICRWRSATSQPWRGSSPVSPASRVWTAMIPAG